MRRLALLVFAFAAMQVLHAQAAVPGILTISPQNCVWRVGDNPAWAAPAINESGWQPFSNWNPGSPEPDLWIRCHADLSSLRNVAHPSLQITLYAAYEVSVDGRLIGTAGNLRSGNFTMNTIRAWPLSGGLAPPSLIALRITRRIVSRIPVGSLPPLAIEAGPASLLRDRRSGVILAQVSPRLIPSICFTIIGVLGIVLLPLWFNDRGRRELLLLSICCLGLPVIYLDYLGAAALIAWPVAISAFTWPLASSTVNVTRVLFFFALARRRVPVVFWILILLANGPYLPALLIPFLAPAHALWLDSLRSRQLEAVGDFFRVFEDLAPFAAFLPWSRLAPRMKPLAALSLAFGTVMVFFFSLRLTAAQIPGIPNLQAHWGYAAQDAEAIVVLSLMAALLVLLFREQQQTGRERAILAGEMQAAQQVQRLLAPAVLDTVPGLRLQVAFRPIGEVGGDFYSCRVLPGSRQRILIGDVSGKGAAAALAAAVLIGAAQRRDRESPAALLAHLNLVFADMRLGGFATCLCADLSPGGSVVIANAGHLAPYRNGSEIDIPGSLPLGLNPDADYSESTVRLAPGDTLTFLSDGVVEAQSPTGELFGFERTRSISTQSAEEIARAAQHFGQQDDITVLTLQFASAEVLHA
ncbi:MAG: PP2C family protein-serine/threonine phosphatase [Acidobacteriaceae bacterium]